LFSGSGGGRIVAEAERRPEDVCRDVFTAVSARPADMSGAVTEAERRPADVFMATASHSCPSGGNLPAETSAPRRSLRPPGAAVAAGRKQADEIAEKWELVDLFTAASPQLVDVFTAASPRPADVCMDASPRRVYVLTDGSIGSAAAAE